MISIIVAASSNLVIGKNNDLPWHIPSDLKRFKELTSGSMVYMTEVLGEIDGDTYLEGFNPEEWSLTNMSEVLEENGFKFIFKEYVKKVA